MEEHYATALWSIIQKGSTVSEATKKLSIALERRGRLALLPRVLRALSRIALRHVSTQGTFLIVGNENDTNHALKASHAHTIQGVLVNTRVDPTLIGGWRLETPSTLIDNSYKKALLDIYRRATS